MVSPGHANESAYQWSIGWLKKEPKDTIAETEDLHDVNCTEATQAVPAVSLRCVGSSDWRHMYQRRGSQDSPVRGKA